MKIIFFGTPELAAPVLKRISDSHTVVMVVTQPDTLFGRKQILTPSPIAKVAEELNLPVLKPGKLTTEIKVADTIEMPYKDHGDGNGKGYQLDLEAVNFTTTEGKIVCLYKRPAVKNGYKNHFINGGYVAKDENGYTAVYPDLAAGLISITRDVAAGNTCNWFQIGIVGQETTEGDTLAITDLEVRIIPNF